MSAVPLQRSFTLVPAPYLKDEVPLDQLWPSLSRGNRKTWQNLLDEHRVIILADAGAGKTYELKSTAERLASAGHPSFFLRLEDIDDTFGTAFEVGSAEAFETWLLGSDEAWFFLDSVDEIRLSEPRAFEIAIEAFASRLQGALQRTHVYISSRPYAWRPSIDQALIEKLLPHERLRQEATGAEAEAADDIFGADEKNKVGNEGEAETLQVYLLAPLEDVDVTLFAEHRAVANIKEFLIALERGNLLTLAQSPFDLQDLISAWLHDGQLGSRLAVLQGSVRRLLARALAAEPGAPAAERALAGAQLLALAATLTGLSNIRLPHAGGVNAIDPHLILSGWNDIEIKTLLGSGVFGDPIFGEVRFRHREIRELLAAEWTNDQLSRRGGRDQLDMLIFRSIYGVDLLPPRLRPLLPWLIIFDAISRDRILGKQPEIAIEGGDAASLSTDVRQKLLTTLIERVVAPTSELRGLDNSAIARIAQRDLEAPIRNLIDQYQDNDDALFVLGRLVWQGELAACVDPLSFIASNPARGIYARLVAIRAVATVGTATDIYKLWRSINEDGHPIPRRLLAELGEYAVVDGETVDLLLESIELLEPRQEFEVTGLTQALNRFIERAPLTPGGATGGILSVLAHGLERYLARQPHIERGECRVSQEFQWVMSPALHIVERLITGRSPAALAPSCLAILAAVPALRFWHGDDFDDRKSVVDALVPAWVELNDALFWYTAEQYRLGKDATGERLVDDWPITFVRHFWKFDAASFSRTLAWIAARDFFDDKLLALARSFTTYVESGRQAEQLEQLKAAVAHDPDLAEALSLKLNPPKKEEGRRYERLDRKYKLEREERDRKDADNRAKFVAELTANPELVRHPPGVKRGQLSRIHYNLLRSIEGDGMRSSRAQGADWRALIPEFGATIAEAYRDAALAHWRVYKPGLRSEGSETNQIPYSLIFAMAGLDIELEADGAATALSKTQVRRAFRYAPWELNGFPRWFEHLYRAWPQIGRQFLWTEILWELANTPADQALHYIISDIIYYAPWLHAEFSPLLFEWLCDHQAPNVATLGNLRTIIIGGRGVTPAEIAALARRKLDDSATPVDQRAVWYALWVDCEPAPAISALENVFASEILAEPQQFAMAFSVALLGGRSDMSPASAFGLFKTPTFLKQLYLLLHGAIPVSDDIERAGKGVYSPTLRDDAQDARERLFALLDQIPGELSYNAIRELAANHAVPHYRHYLQAQAYRHAVNDGDLVAWKVQEVADFARRLKAFPPDPVSTGGAAHATY